MIEVNNIQKSFKIPIRKQGGWIKNIINRNYIEKQAVKEVSFSIEKGEIVGYIGLNGAGKSTTIKILCGILKPDNGSVLINGVDPFKERRKNNQNIGVVFGQRGQLWRDLPVEDSFLLLKKIYSISDTEYKNRINFFEKRLSIKEMMKISTRKLSLGQKMRCEFVGSILHWPDVIYLDEATIGLDILTKRKILDLISELNKMYKKTIVFTTHNMQDIEELCSRVILIHKGSIIYDGSTRELKSKYREQKQLSISFENVQSMEEINISKIASKYGSILSEDLGKMEILLRDGSIEILPLILNELGQTNRIIDYELRTIPFERVIEDIYTNKSVGYRL